MQVSILIFNIIIAIELGVLIYFVAQPETPQTIWQPKNDLIESRKSRVIKRDENDRIIPKS